MKTLIQIQDEYIARIICTHNKWGNTSHCGLIIGSATASATKQILALGFNREQTYNAIRDARDIADLMTAAR